ncbi:MAG: hypothetical protein NC204_05640 [Candidatus Amulumruptor caecigallinarius]|nr:hypothetical protein [Candidatus Amulumruptor caecigallinarius]
MNKDDGDKIEFLHWLGKCSGNVKEACSRSGVARSSYYHWRKTDEEFAMQADIIIGSHKQRNMPDRAEDNTSTSGVSDQHSDEPMLEPGHYVGTKASMLAREHEEFLMKAMETAGIWDECYRPQIRIAAKLHASIDILFSQLDEYLPLQTELSREGNPRLVSNPIHEMIRKQSDTYTSILKSLGLNFDAKVKAKEGDGLETFLNAMNDD